MALMRWSPWRDMMSLQNDMNRVFPGWAATDKEEMLATEWSPHVDIYEDEASIKLHADVPGVSQNDLDVKVENGELHGTVNWDQDQASIALVDPEGRQVDSEYPGAYIFEDSKPAYVVVKNPQPGNWKAMVKSKGQAGGSYDIVVSAQEGDYRLEDYPWALLLSVGVSLIAGAGLFALFRRPIRAA